MIAVSCMILKRRSLEKKRFTRQLVDKVQQRVPSKIASFQNQRGVTSEFFVAFQVIQTLFVEGSLPEVKGQSGTATKRYFSSGKKHDQ